MKSRKPQSYSRNYEKSLNYTSFFTEESLIQRVDEINQSMIEEEASLNSSTKAPEMILDKLKETEEIKPKPKQQFSKYKKPVEEVYDSEESFDMDEDQDKIDLPFQEDELYSNILMEFLPKLKQEIVVNKVQRRRSDVSNISSNVGYSFCVWVNL
jgi:hypothetical protein